MRNTLETRLGMFFAMGLLALVLIFELIGGVDFFHRGVRVRTRFNSIQELRVGDPVKMAGVQIGRVSAISLADNKVEVALKLTRPDRVRTDSKASIKFVGLLGQNYVAIEFGSPTSPQVTDDTVLDSTEQVDLSTIMVKLDSVASGIENVAKSFSGDSLGNLLGPFTDFMKENKPKITALFDNLQKTSTAIANGEGTIGKLIQEDTLYKSAVEAVNKLTATSEDLRVTLSDAKAVVERVNAGEGTVGKLIKDESLFTETKAAMTNAKEILQKVNQGQGTVGKVINDESLFRNAKLTLQKVEKATESLEDQGPMSALGILMNSLF
jgi:phospholipid/cholesterol/gamma-HCH transport system substrate-binding protein